MGAMPLDMPCHLRSLINLNALEPFLKLYFIHIKQSLHFYANSYNKFYYSYLCNDTTEL